MDFNNLNDALEDLIDQEDPQSLPEYFPTQAIEMQKVN